MIDIFPIGDQKNFCLVINGDILLKQQCKSRNVSQGWKYKTHKREYIIDLIKLKFAHKSIIEYLYHTCKI